MNSKNPKYKIGDRVRVKSLAEANKISYAVETNKSVMKYLGKTFVVTGLRKVNGMFYYYLKERSGVCVHECLIDYPYGDFSHPQNPKYSVGDNVVIKEEKETLDPYNVRVAFPKGEPKKSESSNNGLAKWKTMYKDMVEFIGTSSPQTRSFIAGQLYGLTEKLMNETQNEE